MFDELATAIEDLAFKLDELFCDIAADPPDTQGWQRYLVRTEEGENLTALAYGEGLLQFKKA